MENKINDINNEIEVLKTELLSMLEAVEEYYPIGSYIRKHKLGEFFKYHTHEGTISRPYNKIRSVSFNPKTKTVLINGTESYSLYGLPISISQEEAYSLKDIWDAIQLEPISESLNKTHEHFRSDNGNPKEGLKERQARKLLFKWRLQNPLSNYQIYKCSVCDNIHIGKTITSLSNE